MSDEAMLYIIGAMEEKLMELLGEKGYGEFAVEVARKAFINDIERMDDGEFKQFVLDGLNEITK